MQLRFPWGKLRFSSHRGVESPFFKFVAQCRSCMFSTRIDTGKFGELTEKQIAALPDATAFALNQAAFKVRGRWADALPRVFDRPTPYTLRAILYTKATRDNLVATVFVRDTGGKVTPAKYLQAEAYGGARRAKASERALFNLIGLKQFYVPGEGAKELLDQYGNLKGGLLRKIIAQLKKQKTGNDKTGKRKKGRGKGSYFVLTKDRGKLKAGVVYERPDFDFGHVARSVLFTFDHAPRYSIRFDAKKLADELFADEFRKEFTKSFARVLNIKG